MPAYPVGRGGIMLNGAAAPAAAIINNGPGLLYLYRNSAVSTYAYDTVIGPSGSFQWPGGELWAASDAGTTVNVLAGLSSFDSGTTQVAGTVSVAGASSAAGIRVRNTLSGNIQFTYNTIYPTSGASVGDTVYIASFGSNQYPMYESYPNFPYNTVWSIPWTSGNFRVHRCVMTGQNSKETSPSMSVDNSGSASWYSIIIAGDKTWTVNAGGTISAGGVFATGTSIAPDNILACSPAATGIVWPGPLQGGPPSGGKAWSMANGWGLSQADWTTADTYNVRFNGSGTISAFLGKVT